MTSARRLYRLTIALGAFGLVAVLFALLAALGAISLAAPSPSTLLSSCERLLPGAPALAGLVLAAVAALAVAVLVRGCRSLVRQVCAQRHLLERLGSVGRVNIDGTDAVLTADRRPEAFCAGFLRPRIYVSRGALDALAPAELRAVLAHESHHAARRDPLRIMVARALADGLFLLPVVRRSSDRYGALAELAADEAAVATTGDRGGLASALLTFGTAAAPAGAVGIAPERVDHLLGRRSGWRPPVSLLAGSLLAGAGLVATAALAAAAVGDAAISLPMLAMNSCMVVMLALLAALAVWSCRSSLASRVRLPR